MKEIPIIFFACFIVNSISADLYNFLKKGRSENPNVAEFRVILANTSRSRTYDITPLIGIYGTPYRFLERIAYIAIPPIFFDKVLSAKLKNAFKLQTRQDFASTTKTVYAQIAFYNYIGNSPQTYNLVLHQFLRWFTKQKLPNQNLLMGIFEPNGIQAARTSNIAIGKLKQENVNVHNGQEVAYSPNNARFSTVANRQISTFWSLVFSPDKNTVLITLNVLANTDFSLKTIQTLLSRKIKKGAKEVFLVDNLCDFIPGLKTITRNFSNKNDKNALLKVATLLETVLGLGSDKTMIDLSFSYCGLNYNLKQLAFDLSKLA